MEMELCKNMYGVGPYGSNGPWFRITRETQMYPPRFVYRVYCHSELVAVEQTFTDAIRAIPTR